MDGGAMKTALDEKMAGAKVASLGRPAFPSWLAWRVMLSRHPARTGCCLLERPGIGLTGRRGAGGVLLQPQPAPAGAVYAPVRQSTAAKAWRRMFSPG